MTSKPEILFHRVTYTFSPAGSDNQVEHRVTNRELAKRVGGPTPTRMQDLVGRTVTTFAAAPGVGRAIYRVTRVDADGVWAVCTSNSIRIEELTAEQRMIDRSTHAPLGPGYA